MDLSTLKAHLVHLINCQAAVISVIKSNSNRLLQLHDIERKTNEEILKIQQIILEQSTVLPLKLELRTRSIFNCSIKVLNDILWLAESGECGSGQLQMTGGTI